MEVLSFWKNKICKTLARSIKKREKEPNNKIKIESGNITTDSNEIQKILRAFYEQLFPNWITCKKV